MLRIPTKHPFSFGGNLTAYVENGTIPLSRVDDMGQSPMSMHYITHSLFNFLLATRILAGWYFLGQDSLSYPQTNFDAWNPDDDTTNERGEHILPVIAHKFWMYILVDVQDDHYKLVRQIGAAGSVLLKNMNGALPLNKPSNIVLIGSDAGPGSIGPNEFTDQVSTHRSGYDVILS